MNSVGDTSRLFFFFSGHDSLSSQAPSCALNYTESTAPLFSPYDTPLPWNNTMKETFHAGLLYLASLSTLTLLLGTIALSGILYILYNLIAWYKFLAAWNLISRAHRMDTLVARRRRKRLLSRHGILRSFWNRNDNDNIHVDSMHRSTECPICLVDFFEHEQVTACEEGCGHWFHRECLFRWLEESEKCPCCRIDLLQSGRDETSWWQEVGLCFGRNR